MRGLAILLGFNLVGVMLNQYLHVPLPGNVLGLVLFTAALFARAIKLEWVEDSALFMLKHMMIFFAPVIAGTIVFFPLIGQHLLSILVSLVVSTLVVLLITGYVTSLMTKKGVEAE